MVTSMTKSSESPEESEHQVSSNVEYFEHVQDIQAAKLAGAKDIKAFQSTNLNLHSGSAGGDAHESIQIVAIDEKGQEKILAERSKPKPVNDQPENMDTSTLLAIEAKVNPVAKVISLFRSWIEGLPSGKQKEEYREISRAQAAELSPEIKSQLDHNRQIRLESGIEYTHFINDSACSIEVGRRIAQLSVEDQIRIIGSGLQAGIDQYRFEERERTWGQLIGTVEGIGEVFIGLAKVADFAALLILNDPEKIEKSASDFNKAFARTIASGIKLFGTADNYLYNIGFEGDYGKPFCDVQILGTLLNQRWSALPPREQERIKANLITQLSIDGILGMASANNINRTGKFTELVDTIASDLAEVASEAKNGGKKIILALDDTVKELLIPAGDTGLGMKVKIPRDAADEIKNDTKSLMGKSRKGEVHKGRLRHPESNREPFGWKIKNERFANDVIRQINDLSCTSAVGEMLSNGKFLEEEILKQLGDGAFLDELVTILGPNWSAKTRTFKSLEEISQHGSWGATFYGNNYRIHHSVVIDGISKSGDVMIRDSWEGTKYEMTKPNFFSKWSGHAIYRINRR